MISIIVTENPTKANILNKSTTKKYDINHHHNGKCNKPKTLNKTPKKIQDINHHN